MKIGVFECVILSGCANTPKKVKKQTNKQFTWILTPIIESIGVGK